jgi:hypothetical protein
LIHRRERREREEREERRESAAHLGECGSTVGAFKEGMLRGDISAAEEEKACEPIGEKPEVAAGGVRHKRRGEREGCATFY